MEKIFQICSSRENGYLLITNSWYVIAVAIFYFIFFLAFSWCGNDYRVCIKRIFLGIVLFVAVAFFMRLGGWWIYSSFSFIAGIVWKEKEESIKKFINDGKWGLLLFSNMGIFVFWFVARAFNSFTIQSEFIYILCVLMYSAAFACLVFVLLAKISIINRFWRFIGSISFEIYLLHELIYNLLRNKKLGFYVQSDLIYVLLVIAVSIGLAYVFKKSITENLSRLINRTNKLGGRN